MKRMKENGEEQTTRRKFFKKASAGAVAAMVTGIGGRAGAAEGGARQRGRKNQLSKKLGELVQQPADSAFTRLRKRRLPGWRPDAAEVQGADEDEIYYPEQLVGKRVEDDSEDPFRELFDYFPTPKTGCVDFAEPPVGETAAWHEFNKWILGYELDENKTDARFWRLLDTLANLFRRYNKALHRLRRLHFHKHAPKDSKRPPRNPADSYDADDLPCLDTFSGKENYIKGVAEAERNFESAIMNLNAFLDGNHVNSRDFADFRVDAVEVNGYVVSMRVVTGFGDDYKEIGGSSSSHISISSPFKP